jgi:acetyl-CoA carboxylase biotin carboxylase subunit
MIKKILIANRGEIAIRVARACREMNIKSVAIYSEADRISPHVYEADEAVFVGSEEPISSYLNMDKIISVAKQRGVDAIHPGYGFLAENHEFSRKCRLAGLTFIGPEPDVLMRVGDKVQARRLMQSHGIEIIPGMIEPSLDQEKILRQGDSLGYPLIIKAVSGGGGKGMRVVENSQELRSAISSAISEAQKAFGDGHIYLERYLERPRHIEFQILGDQHGNLVHLFERECSIQRRYQKLVEETPSTALDAELRTRMADTAIRVARAVGYTNAGTIEFLLDQEGNFYFLEVNARLQVEHPVTELTTGVDIVKKQIEIASGEPLNIEQTDICPRGHAIECRIYAEDPEQEFRPSPGRVLFYREPAGPGIRIDSGICEAYEVPVHYDPILSKLIVWAEDRPSAISRMMRGLKDYAILGIKTTAPFLLSVIGSDEFRKGDLHVNFIDEHFKNWHPPDESLQIPLAGYFGDEFLKDTHLQKPYKEREVPSPWNTLGAWRI